jgi:hypothetical protein
MGQMAGSTTPAQRTTSLLGRVATFGVGTKDSLEVARRLTVGDRVALLLELRRLTFGDKMDCIVNCPSCDEEMSVNLSAKAFLHAGSTARRSQTEVSVGGFNLRIRPVTGADLEALDPEEHGAGLAEALVRSCILSSDRPLPSRIPDEVMAKVSSKLEDLDPQADIVLDLTCPACKLRFKTPFFIDDFMAREVRSRAPQLERDVHWIAFNYHWSEQEILSLPVRQRGKYVELINRTIAGETI